jgi:hypothetical protein
MNLRMITLQHSQLMRANLQLPSGASSLKALPTSICRPSRLRLRDPKYHRSTYHSFPNCSALSLAKRRHGQPFKMSWKLTPAGSSLSHSRRTASTSCRDLRTTQFGCGMQTPATLFQAHSKATLAGSDPLRSRRTASALCRDLLTTQSGCGMQIPATLFQAHCYVPYLILVLRAHLCFPFIASFLICTYRTALPLIPD